MGAPNVPAGLKCPVRSHTALGGLWSPPWLCFAGQVLCLHGLLREDTCHLSQPGQGGDDTEQLLVVPTQVFTARCLFPHYTFPGFFYTFIQDDPGCVVSLFVLLGSICEDKKPGKELSLEDCTRHRSGSFPGGAEVEGMTGLNASWWQSLCEFSSFAG